MAGRCATACRHPRCGDGIAYVTEDRKVEGFFETMSVAGNIYLGLLAKVPAGRFFLSPARGRQGRHHLDRDNSRCAPPASDMKVDRTVGRQPAESGDCQIAGAGSGADHLR